jgi:hypothetical protein
VSDAAISECALQLGIQNFTCSRLMLNSAEAGARGVGGSLQLPLPSKNQAYHGFARGGPSYGSRN